MSLLGLGYGLGGFMKGLNEQQNQQLLQQLSRLDLQRVQQQIQAQQQQDQAAKLLFPALLAGGAQQGQSSVPQFGGGPFGGGAGSTMPPAAAQPSLPPGGPDRGGAGAPPSFGSGPTFSGIGDYGGGEPPGMGDYYAPAPGSGGGNGASPLSGPRVSASRYGGMAVDPSFGPVLARDPVVQGPAAGPSVADAALLPEFSPGGSGQYTYDSSGNLIDQVTGSPVSSVSSRAATPTTDIPPAATAPSSPPGFSGSSAAAGPSLSAGGDTTSVPGGFNAGYQALVNLGVSPDVARGAVQYMAHNESGSNPLAVNPRSGALGRAQWLGSRKAALENMYGRRPSDAQQATFLQQELLGGESGTLQQLRNATTAKQGYDIWGRSFERPGGAALAQAGVGSGGGVPGSVASLGAGGGGGGVNDAILQQAMGLIQKGLAPVPESLYGRMSTQQLARQIENANPNADPVVKMLALERGMKLLAPEDRLATQQYMQEHQDLFRVGLAVLQSQLTQGRAADKPGEVVQLPGGGVGRVTGNTIVPLKIQGQEDQPTIGVTRLPTGGGARSGAGTNVTVTDDQGKVVYDGAAIPKAGGGYTQPDGTPLPKGTVKLMGKGKEDAGEPKPEQGTVDMIKSYTRAGLTVPYSFRTGKQGQANFQEALKELNQEGFTGADVALAQGDVKALDSAYRQMQALTSKVTSYSNLAKQNIAAAADKLKDTAPTDFGPLVNRFIVEGELMLGDPDVVGAKALVFASANELAKVLGGSTGAAAATDSSRKEAMEILSPYFSSGQFSEAAKIANAEIDRRISGMNNELNSLRNRLKTGAGPAPGGPERKGTPSATPGGGQPSPTSSAPRVGDVVTGPDGKKYRVLTLDRDGQPDDVELAEPAQ